MPGINGKPVNLGGRFARNAVQACLRVRLSMRAIPSRAFTSPRPTQIARANFPSREDVLGTAGGVLARPSTKTVVPVSSEFGLRVASIQDHGRKLGRGGPDILRYEIKRTVHDCMVTKLGCPQPVLFAQKSCSKSSRSPMAPLPLLLPP